jgi:phosphate transport system ATP-binding protein
MVLMSELPKIEIKTGPGGGRMAGGAAAKRMKFSIDDLHAWYGSHEVLRDITLDIGEKKVTAVIGPSGCGKSTFIRTLNRMHETIRGAGQSGKVLLDGENIFDKSVDPVLLRRRVGMVFQKPNPFPAMSIRDNVVAGLRLTGLLKNFQADTIAEKALKQAALWNEVKDHMNKPGGSLSGGQQQRLCIARSLAVNPEVLLMDEPCSALDPIATAKIEELIRQLREEYTIIIVTHNMQQAARVSDKTAFFLTGDLVEYDITEKLFTKPSDKRTEDYITGKFG